MKVCYRVVQNCTYVFGVFFVFALDILLMKFDLCREDKPAFKLPIVCWSAASMSKPKETATHNGKDFKITYRHLQGGAPSKRVH